MALSCPLEITRCVPQENSFLFYIINLLLTELVRSRYLDIGLVLFLHVYGPRLYLVPETRSKEFGQYPAILTTRLVNNPYLLYGYNSCVSG